MGRFTKPDLLLDQPEQILRILGNNSVGTAHLNVDRTCVGKAYRFSRLLKCAGGEPTARLRVHFKVQAQVLCLATGFHCFDNLSFPYDLQSFEVAERRYLGVYLQTSCGFLSCGGKHD